MIDSAGRREIGIPRYHDDARASHSPLDCLDYARDRVSEVDGITIERARLDAVGDAECPVATPGLEQGVLSVVGEDVGPLDGHSKGEEAHANPPLHTASGSADCLPLTSRHRQPRPSPGGIRREFPSLRLGHGEDTNSSFAGSCSSQLPNLLIRLHR